jgi:hypothetical protein
MGKHQDKCRLHAVVPMIELVQRSSASGSRMTIEGVNTCKSRLCPLCGPKWIRTRSDEITRAIERWPGGPERVAFVSATMRHHKGMKLALQHRLQRAAWGNLWGGRRGQLLAAELGGRPESIRAHDGTWSAPKGWHPHLHALLFLQSDVTDEVLLGSIESRWWQCLATALVSFERLLLRVARKDACGRRDCPVCYAPRLGPVRQRLEWCPLESRAMAPYGPLAHELRWVPIDVLGVVAVPPSERGRDECPHLRERATRVFGVRLVKKHVSLQDSARQLLTWLERFFLSEAQMLRDYCRAESLPVVCSAPLLPRAHRRPYAEFRKERRLSRIKPNQAHGVAVERMRNADRLPRYLAKMGLELANFGGKLGHEGSDGVTHYAVGELAQLACTHGHPLRAEARRAYGDLFWSTVGTQTITFSDRDALGLDADPYGEGEEPPEERSDEISRVIGLIAAERWRQRAALKKHELHAELQAAFEAGELADLEYVEAVNDARARPLSRKAAERGPPSSEFWEVGPDGCIRQWGATVDLVAERASIVRTSTAGERVITFTAAESRGAARLNLGFAHVDASPEGLERARQRWAEREERERAQYEKKGLL